MGVCALSVSLKSTTSHYQEYVSSDIVFDALQIQEQVLEDGMLDVFYQYNYTLEVIPVSNDQNKEATYYSIIH